jgi:uncharacterized protein (TIGR03437 family)
MRLSISFRSLLVRGALAAAALILPFTSLHFFSVRAVLKAPTENCGTESFNNLRRIDTDGQKPSDTAAADFDTDGRPDLAIANHDSGMVGIMFANRTDLFSFDPPANITPIRAPVALVTADFNNDGFADIAVVSNPADRIPGQVLILLNNGNGTLAPPVSYDVNLEPGAIAAADFNSDGKTDLAIAGAGSNSVAALINQGNGAFNPATGYMVGAAPSDLVAADFNGDNKPDLAIANSGSNNISLLLNQGSGVFGVAINTNAGSIPSAICAVDFDGDGRRDLAVANLSTNNVSVLSGNGDGSFGAALNFAVAAQPTGLVADDFNSDGKTDLAAASFGTGNISLLYGNGAFGFDAAVTVAAGKNLATLITDDLNSDRRPDLIAVEETDHQIVVAPNACGALTIPSITSLSPNSAAAGSAQLLLTINGANFRSNYQSLWNGQARPTSFVSATQLVATISAADLAVAGTAKVAVSNPGFGDAVSRELDFTIAISAPALDSLSVTSAPVGSGAFDLTLSGSGFALDSIVQFDGVARATTFVSATRLMTRINASDLITARVIRVTVVNPAPGGTSNVLIFTVENPLPSLSSLSPSTALVASQPFTLRVSGANFVSGSIVRWNGLARATNFVSATALTAQITAADLAVDGRNSVTVFNPGPGGGVSNAATFTVLQQADLSLGMTAAPDPITLNGNVTFTITVVNNGPGAAGSVVVTDHLPSTVSYSSCEASGGGVCSNTGNSVRVNFNTLASGASAVIRISAKIAAAACTLAAAGVPNSASVTSATTDPNTGNNSISVNPARESLPLRITQGMSALSFNLTAAAREANTSAQSQSFRLENPGCQPAFVRLSVTRIGAEVDNGKITIPDDSGAFIVEGISESSASVPTGAAVFRLEGGAPLNVRVTFAPKLPAPAGKTTSLAASQVIPELINSLLTITPVNAQGTQTGNPINVPLSGRVSPAVKLINPLAPRLAPLVVLQKSGADEFTVECSLHDPNLDAHLIRYQFLDGAGRAILQPPDFDLNLSSAGLIRGQSFSIVKKFTGARNNPGVQRVQVIVYDGGGSDSAISAPIGTATGRVVNVSAANFSPSSLAAESIAAAFGVNLSTMTETAVTMPLPTRLGGARVFVTDSHQIEREAPLFFVSPNQINYLIPAGVAPGEAKVVVASDNGALSLSTMQIALVAPSLFTANASGSGVAAALALRVRANNEQSYEAVAEFDGQKFIPRPIDSGASDDQLYLILFGAGVRHEQDLSAITARIGGVPVEVLYAGPQGSFTGLDQINLKLPRTLAGRGEVEIELSVNGQAANPVRIALR